MLSSLVSSWRAEGARDPFPHYTRWQTLKMYPEEMVHPMREELTGLGFREMRTPQEVDALLDGSKGTVLVVNSICGCAAGRARPAVALALDHQVRPATLATVFAGQDAEATARTRDYLTGYPPSSPSIALLREGQLVFMLERRDIEGRDSFAIAEDLISAFDRFCAPERSEPAGNRRQQEPASLQGRTLGKARSPQSSRLPGAATPLNARQPAKVAPTLLSESVPSARGWHRGARLGLPANGGPAE
jgi:putative YphP/YqiW family bacilliredoxin